MNNDLLDIISQVAVAILGVGAIFLVGRKSPNIRRVGFVAGVCSQPFWFYTFIHNGQWILFGVALAYTASWVSGLCNHWRIYDQQ